MASPPLACVLGEIDVVRALRLADIECAVAAVPGDPALFARGVVARVQWHDPWDRAEEMAGSLLDFAAEQQRPPVLYFNGDHDLSLVSRFRSVLRPSFRFVIASPDLIDDLLDKDRFFELSQRLELPVPRTVRVDGAADGPPRHDLDFPLVVKPLTRRDDVWRPIASGGKALAVESPAELERLWPRLAGVGRLLLQEVVEGPEDRIASYHVYVDDGGAIVCEFTGRKIRTLPPRFGDTTALEITELHDVRTLGREVIDKIGLRGVAKLDFKRNDEDRLHLLEINPRFNLWHHAGALAGVNIPATVYADLTGGRRPPTRPLRTVRWTHLTRDLQSARSEGVPLRKWLRDAAGADARWAISLKDPMPFVRGVVLRRVRNKMSRGRR